MFQVGHPWHMCQRGTGLGDYYKYTFLVLFKGSAHEKVPLPPIKPKDMISCMDIRSILLLVTSILRGSKADTTDMGLFVGAAFNLPVYSNER